MEHGSRLESILPNPFLVETVGMSTASSCSRKLFDRVENKWIDVEIDNGALYVNGIGPVYELEWIQYGGRYELIFKCEHNQNLKFFVSISGDNQYGECYAPIRHHFPAHPAFFAFFYVHF